MNITLDFARTLIEGDQLARSGRHDEALVVYLSLSRLPGLDPTESALASSRLARIRVLVEEQGPDEDSLRVVARSPVLEPPSNEARAEVLANSGDLVGAAEIYRQITAADPANALARERLEELEASLPGDALADAPVDLVLDDVVATAASAAQHALSAVVDWRGSLPEDPVAMLELLLSRVRSQRRTGAPH
ncbi:MAG: hypothetical protein ABIJ09_18790 [Pseudomonadota bacterium]